MNLAASLGPTLSARLARVARRARCLTLSLVFVAGAAPTALSADAYSDQWGPAIGQPLPLLDAPDHTGKTRSLDDLTGKNGLLLFMNRSTDW